MSVGTDVVTIYEVAQRSGVSTATVSRVMRNGGGFSASTRERVLAAVGELGWVPNGSARGLVIRRTGIVGVLFPDLAKSGEAEEESPLYVDQIIRGAERAATSAGDAVLIAATHSATGRELAYSVAGKVDGLVVLAGSLSEADLASIARSLPVVVLADDSARHTFDFVRADNRSGSREVTAHLLGHGYRDIAFIGGAVGTPDSMERFAGFVEAMTAAGLAVASAPDAYGQFTETGGERAMLSLLAQRPQPPRAVVLGNDQMAIGAIAALRAARLRVPADVAITGFDNITSARHLRPPLTTVRQPIRELGERSVRLLLQRLADPTARTRSVVLPTERWSGAAADVAPAPVRSPFGRRHDPPS